MFTGYNEVEFDGGPLYNTVNADTSCANSWGASSSSPTCPADASEDILSSALACVLWAVIDVASVALKVVNSATARVSKSEGVASWSFEQVINALLNRVLQLNNNQMESKRGYKEETEQ